MHKVKPILTIICTVLAFIACIQIYLLLRMSFFDEISAMFLYGALFAGFCSIAIGFNKRSKLLLISGILCLTVFFSMRFSIDSIEAYYLKQVVAKGDVIKRDLDQYHNLHNEFPTSLKILYYKSLTPGYNIGLLKYSYSYYKTDTSYRLYFNFFGGRTFINKGEYYTWILDD